MVNWTVVRADCIEIHADIIETGRNKPYGRNEPGGSASGASGQAKPLVKAGRGAECSQGYSVRVDSQLGEPRE